MSWADAIRREWSEAHRAAERWPEDCPDYDPAYDREERECPECNGTGAVLNERPGSASGVDECDTCDGEGTVEVRL